MSNHKNILLITADQWRGDCLSMLNHPLVQTPNLDSLAAESVIFKKHYTNAVPCSPSRACMHTGLYLHNHRVGTNGTPLDRRFTNWALELRSTGYDPVLFGYTHTAMDPRGVPKDDPRLNTDEGVLPGINPLVDMATHCTSWREWLANLGYSLPENHGATYGVRKTDHIEKDIPIPLIYDSEHTDTRFLTKQTIDYINKFNDEDNQNTNDSQGWCVHLSLRAPHPPWVAAEPYNRLYPIKDLPATVRHETPQLQQKVHPWLAKQLTTDRNQSHENDHRHRLLQSSYYGLMSEVDDNMGLLVNHLRQTGQLENTLLIFTSDHGEQMGDHWQYGKAGFYDQSYFIPLIIRSPGIKPSSVNLFSEHVDIMPTILDWLGLDIPRQADGHSLLPALQGNSPSNWRQEVHWEFDFRDPGTESDLNLQMEEACLNVIRDDEFKYVHFAGLPDILFNLQQDPQELNNVAAHNPSVVSEYAKKLLSWRMCHTDKTLSHIRLRREKGMVVRKA